MRDASLGAQKDPTRTADLLAYALLIIHAARQYKGNGWQAYDTNFRSQAAATKSVSWAQLNPTLGTSVFCNPAPKVHCDHCMSLDYSTEACHREDLKSLMSDGSAAGMTEHKVGFDAHSQGLVGAHLQGAGTGISAWSATVPTGWRSVQQQGAIHPTGTAARG